MRYTHQVKVVNVLVAVEATPYQMTLRGRIAVDGAAYVASLTAPA